MLQILFIGTGVMISGECGSILSMGNRDMHHQIKKGILIEQNGGKW